MIEVADLLAHTQPASATMGDAFPRGEVELVIAVQCALLSRAGGGLPSAILPVIPSLQPFRAHLVTVEPPEQAPPVPLTQVRAGLPFVSSSLAVLEAMEARLVHTHGLWTSLSAGALAHARRKGAALVVSPHGMLDPWALRQSRWKKRAVMALIERRHMESATIHALNAAERDAIRALGVTSPVAVIPNGIDPAPLELPPPPAFMDRPTLLFLGRIHTKKGISELIAAWSLIADSLPAWQLAVAGWDDGANTFRDEAARANGRIIFPGAMFGEDKVAAFAHTNAFVLPSFSEGLPMTVLEAWSHGKPVLMTDACNLPEGFNTGAATRITTDPAAMAEVLAAHLPDEGWRERTGNAGRRLVADCFTWDAIAAAFRALYNYTLGQGPRPETLDG